MPVGRGARPPSWGSHSKRYRCRIHQSTLLSRQRCKTGDPGFGMWPAIEPRCESVDIDRRSYGEVLEPSFRQSHIPAVPQPKGTNTLRERPFNTGALRVLRLPFCGVLLLPERLQRLVFVLRFQGHMAWVRLRLGTLFSRLTVPTILIRELDTDNRIVPPIVLCTPR